MKIFKRTVLIIGGIVALAAICFLIWSQITYKPTNELKELVDLSEVTDNKEGSTYVFTPEESSEVGIIFYPGAKVETLAYSYLAEQIANEGYNVFIPSMPLNFAVFGVNRADDVMELDESITTWYIGGHSLGGSMAAAYTKKHSDKVDGLFFLGSYTTDSSNLSELTISSLSIYAEFDGLSTLNKIEKNRIYNPKSTKYVEIKGGNHAQFGMYGEQKNDLEASISSKKQQDLIIEEIINWLE
ncbi:alpha/beta hydrolase [Oceanobacillus sojae]|uniref:alpha/beta hydrolase n=1 Tax=Oceanobacillus sojae TaxID=582851 RepID=UPI0021A4D7AD|nr:alpha/beta hydrolase [Oceanobacillus sojae]MCT1902486.1 alpha/beta hydrolase [Oceanobacillus sojae]